MKIEVWETDNCITAVIEDDINKENLIDIGAILIRTIEGSDWNDCMKQHHKLMEWNPYIPFEDL